MTRSLTSTLYRAARFSNNVRAASRGPGAYAKASCAGRPTASRWGAPAGCSGCSGSPSRAPPHPSAVVCGRRGILGGGVGRAPQAKGRCGGQAERELRASLRARRDYRPPCPRLHRAAFTTGRSVLSVHCLEPGFTGDAASPPFDLLHTLADGLEGETENDQKEERQHANNNGDSRMLDHLEDDCGSYQQPDRKDISLP